MNDWRDKADRLLADLRLAKAMADTEADGLSAMRNRLSAALEAQAALQAIAQGVQTQAHARIADIVSKCLRAVFGPEAYGFRIDFDRKRGKTEARMAFVRNGKDVDPVGAAGGGVLQVAAFGLRVAALVLATPRRRRLLVLDEPLAQLSAEYVPNVAALIETLAEELSFQVILSTHSQGLRVGKVIEIGG